MPTTVIRPGVNPDYNTPEHTVYWAYMATEEEQPTFDEEGVLVTDELGAPVMETVELERPKYREDRLAGFPTHAEAVAHAATVRAMRFA